MEIHLTAGLKADISVNVPVPVPALQAVDLIMKQV